MAKSPKLAVKRRPGRKALDPHGVEFVGVKIPSRLMAAVRDIEAANGPSRSELLRRGLELAIRAHARKDRRAAQPDVSPLSSPEAAAPESPPAPEAPNAAHESPRAASPTPGDQLHAAISGAGRTINAVAMLCRVPVSALLAITMTNARIEDGLADRLDLALGDPPGRWRQVQAEHDKAQSLL